MPYQSSYGRNTRGRQHEGSSRDWWETNSGDHIEPVGGAASGIAKSFTGGNENDVSQWIDSHRDLTFGTGDRPGILGTGRFQGDYYTPDAAAATIPGFAGFQAATNAGMQTAGDRAALSWGGTQMDEAAQAQFREGQMALMQQLLAQSRGEGPSLAQGQLQRATDQNMAQAMAMAASQRGQSAGAAQRAIANQRGMIGQQMAGDSAQLRLQEQMAAQNMLGQVAGQGRQQDLGLAQAQAGFRQQTGLANLQAGMQQRAQNDQMVQFYLRSGMDLARAQQQAAMDMERLRVQQNLAQVGQQQQAYQNSAQANQGLVRMVGSIFTGGAMGGAGGMGQAGQVDTSGGQFMGAQTQGPGMMPSGWQLGG